MLDVTLEELIGTRNSSEGWIKHDDDTGKWNDEQDKILMYLSDYTKCINDNFSEFFIFVTINPVMLHQRASHQASEMKQISLGLKLFVNPQI